jgi:predicted nucleotidyltransferase
MPVTFTLDAPYTLAETRGFLRSRVTDMLKYYDWQEACSRTVWDFVNRLSHASIITLIEATDSWYVAPDEFYIEAAEATPIRVMSLVLQEYFHEYLDKLEGELNPEAATGGSAAGEDGND